MEFCKLSTYLENFYVIIIVQGMTGFKQEYKTSPFSLPMGTRKAILGWHFGPFIRHFHFERFKEP